MPNSKKLPHDVRNTMAMAATEIRQLRQANELLVAQMSVVRVFERALMGTPMPQGFGEDVAWKIDRLLNPPQPVVRVVPDDEGGI